MVTVYCRSCGEAIEREAKVCPYCGVRNRAATNPSSGPADVQHETPRAGQWWYGVAICGLLWLIIGRLSFASINSLSNAPSLGAMSSALGTSLVEMALRLIVWILFPLAMYFDTDYVTDVSEWNPNGVIYATIGGFLPILHAAFVVIGLFTSIAFTLVVPLLGIGVSSYYLKQRRGVLGER